MGYDAYGPVRPPRPPRPSAETTVVDELLAAKRNQERGLGVARSASVRATGQITTIGPADQPELADVPPGGGVSITFTPPAGGLFKVSTRLDAQNLTADSTISLIARGISAGGPGGAVTGGVQAGQTAASVPDVDAGSEAIPVTVLAAWNDPNAEAGPADFTLTFICTPF